MLTDEVVILGAGGHGKVVADAYRLCHQDARVRICDDDTNKQGAHFLDMIIETPIRPLTRFSGSCHVAIGDNSTRRAFGLELGEAGVTLITIVHPRATISRYAILAKGVFVAASGIVAADSRVGDGVIINHGVIVDHECSIGDWSHIAPGAVLGGAVSIGASCLIGSGAVVLPGVSIGTGAVVGAGAVVTRDVAAGVSVRGAPARETNE